MCLKDRPMNLNSLAHLIRDDVTTCSVVFNSNRGQQYTFKITKKLAEECEAGDILVVDTRGGLKIAILVEAHEESQLNPEDTDILYSWAFQRVDRTSLDILLHAEHHIEERLRDRRKLSHRQQALAALGISDPSEFIKSLPSFAEQAPDA